MNNRSLATRSEKTALMYDYENFHNRGGTNGTKYVVFGDAHVSKL